MTTKTVLMMAATLTLSLAAYAQEPLRNDPRRPVEAISRDLGVSPQVFIDCFEGVRPAPKGEPPEELRKRMNKDVLLPCLQKANPQLTNEKLDEVMDRHRPGGREGQMSKEDIEAISRDLGVSSQVLMTCFNSTRPAPSGDRPTKESQKRMNKEVPLPCLQKANPKLTNEKLDEVMVRHRPGGREGQMSKDMPPPPPNKAAGAAVN